MRDIQPKAFEFKTGYSFGESETDFGEFKSDFGEYASPLGELD
jgi:hypothetical protein